MFSILELVKFMSLHPEFAFEFQGVDRDCIRVSIDWTTMKVQEMTPRFTMVIPVADFDKSDCNLTEVLQLSIERIKREVNNALDI